MEAPLVLFTPLPTPCACVCFDSCILTALAVRLTLDARLPFVLLPPLAFCLTLSLAKRRRGNLHCICALYCALVYSVSCIAAGGGGGYAGWHGNGWRERSVASSSFLFDFMECAYPQWTFPSLIHSCHPGILCRNSSSFWNLRFAFSIPRFSHR